MKLVRIHTNTFISGEMSNEDYHAHDGISGTGLSKIYSSSVLSWLQTIRKQSDALGFGIASHAAFMEPELFEREFYRELDESEYPDALKTAAQMKDCLKSNGLKTSGTKAELAERIKTLAQPRFSTIESLTVEHDKANEGKTGVSPKNYDALMKMRDRLMQDRDIFTLLESAKIECSIVCDIDFYDHFNEGEPNDGQWVCTVKIRPDMVSNSGFLIDYKTCLDCYGKFKRDVFNLNYDLKMALQHDVMTLAFGREPSGVCLLAQNKLAPSEESSPHEYKPWLLDDVAIENGRKKYLIAIKRYIEYKQSGVAIGRGNEPEYLETPNWALV